jgi:hypothetical protein
VLQDNNKAIQVYKQIGFNIERNLLSYKGNLLSQSIPNIKLEKINFDTYFIDNQDHKMYAWDFDKYALINGSNNYQFYKVYFDTEVIGQFAIEMNKKYLAQYYCPNETEQNYHLLLGGVACLVSEINIINVDAYENKLIDALVKFGLNNHVSQYEMSMDL